MIGASGAIAGVVVAYAMLRPCAKITALVFAIPMRISAYWIIGVFVFMQFMNLASASESEVAYWCHIGGMAAAVVLFPADAPARRGAVRMHPRVKTAGGRGRRRCRRDARRLDGTLTPE